MFLGGYSGKILRIDLSSNSKISIERLKENTAYNFLGGRGFAIDILFNELRPKTDSLGVENKLVIMTGPLTGTEFPGSGRVSIASKSPLTNTFFDSSMGGSFGAHLKWNRFDGIVIEGRAEKPVYLVIDGGKVYVKQASQIWGKTTSDTEAFLRDLYKRSAIATIGPAGENKVSIANIISETRTAGRGGLGAVMGSKNLKAIVVRGGKKVTLAYKEKYKEIVRKIRRTIEFHPITGTDGSMARFGTSLLIHRMAVADMLPKNDFSKDNHMDYEEVDPFSGETVSEKYLIGRKACYGCPTGCGRRIKIDKRIVKGPEYETTAMLGPNTGFYDFEKEIVPLSLLCDELGMDTISCGNILGFARRLGNVVNINEAKQLLEDTSYGRTIYSKGIKEATKQLKMKGDSSQIKGLELPAYDPRKSKGIALAYATSSRGGCHLKAYVIAPEILSNPEFVDPQREGGKAELIRRIQDWSAIYDSLVACKFHSFALFNTLEYDLYEIAKALSAATGFRFSNELLYEIGGRIYTLERLFNIREGFSQKDDALPRRFNVDLSTMLEEYYRFRGWNSEGVPKGYPSMKEPTLVKKDEILKSSITRIKPPEVQVALDMDADLETICNIAKQSYKGGARIIEAGTPAIKRHGTDQLIRVLKEVAPKALIVADLKIMDVGNLEAKIAFRSGADIASVLAVSGINVIKEALSEAIRNDKVILIDLIGCENPLSKLSELTINLRNYEDSVIFCLHRGISEQLKGRGIHEQKQLISEAIQSGGKFLLAIAGGIKEGTIKEIAQQGVEIFVVGSAIYNSTDPEDTTRRILKEIRSNYVKRLVRGKDI